MSLRNIFSVVCSISFLILLVGCEESAVDPPTGTIVGRVNLKDEFDVNMHNHSGVSVTIDQLDEIIVQSDQEGYWMLEEIPEGIYTFRFEKDGFGASWRESFQFIGLDTFEFQTVELHELPSFTIVALSIEPDMRFNPAFIAASGSISTTASFPRRIVLYWGHNTNVSFLPDEHILFTVLTIQSDQIFFTDVGSFVYHTQHGIVSGDTLYARPYPGANGDGFYSSNGSKWRYSALGQPI